MPIHAKLIFFISLSEWIMNAIILSLDWKLFCKIVWDPRRCVGAALCAGPIYFVVVAYMWCRFILQSAFVACEVDGLAILRYAVKELK